MCTVTALPRSLLSRTWRSDPLLLRVACNRDERLTRPAAVPPMLMNAGACSAVMPIDPESGGTWIAANDMGVVLAILNANPGWPVPRGDVSRGLIIPSLVASTTVSEALRRAQDLRANRYAPFRLLLFDRYQLVECWPEAGRIRHRRSFLYGAVMRTSSALGDAVVTRPRRALFTRVFHAPDDPCAAQDRFHEHVWPGREAVSVNMRRPDARTMSRTIVEIGLNTVSMSYHSIESTQPIVVRVAA
jgi:hypothetical protein